MTAQCIECFALHGIHLPECGQAPTGIGIGVRRKRVTTAERKRWSNNKRRLFDRDAHCRFPNCFGTRLLHPHHVETVQEGFARGLDWPQIDRLSNLVALCGDHHGWVHDGIFLDEAIELGLRKPTPRNAGGRAD